MLVVAPLHAVAYLREEGLDEGGAIEWTPHAYEAAPWLWDWADSHDVYVWYGRITSVLLVLMLLGAIALHRRQARAERRFERWAFRAFAVGATLLSAGALLEYYTPFLDTIFMFVALPGLFLTLITGTLFGIATARADAVPTWVGVLLAVAFLPGMPLLVAMLGHIPIGTSLLAIAWILVATRLRRSELPVATTERSGAVS